MILLRNLKKVRYRIFQLSAGQHRGRSGGAAARAEARHRRRLREDVRKVALVQLKVLRRRRRDAADHEVRQPRKRVPFTRKENTRKSSSREQILQNLFKIFAKFLQNFGKILAKFCQNLQNFEIFCFFCKFCQIFAKFL